MALFESISRLGGWESYRCCSGERVERSGVGWCVLRLIPLLGRRRVCSGCGQRVSAVHDVAERKVRDLPIFDAPVELVVQRQRVLCPDCGPKIEALSWLSPYARVTARLAASVARPCKVTSIRHVAQFFGLDWKTVKDIDCAALEQEMGPIDLSGVEILGMDEFAIQKGHRYATVIVDPTCKRVLWVGRGRGREDVRPFSFLFPPPPPIQKKAAGAALATLYSVTAARLLGGNYVGHPWIALRANRRSAAVVRYGILPRQ